MVVNLIRIPSFFDLYLPSAYLVYGEVMFSVLSAVSLSVLGGGDKYPWDYCTPGQTCSLGDPPGPDPGPPNPQGDPPVSTSCSLVAHTSIGKRAIGLLLKGLLVVLRTWYSSGRWK